MHRQEEEPRFVWPGNDEILHRRHSAKPRRAHHRVTLGAYAFIKGWLVSFGAWFAFSLLVTIIDSFSSQTSLAWSLWGVVLLFSFFIAVLIGAPAALVLSLLLRPVRRQWIHVLAFGAGFALLTTAIVYLLVPGTPAALPLGLAAVVGTATGLGRSAIRHDVDEARLEI
ncbi:hypothetical protein ABIB26_003692 [Arthrobacter sp. UYEF20]